jgi:CRP/FNR family transcriptional regulator, cyclic AMP receptor protein
LAHDNVIVRVWTDQIFGASNYPIDDLARAVDEADFGVLVVTPDDRVMSRGDEQDAPRDNVVFELGMLIAGIGRTRSDLPARIAPLCNSIRDKIRDLGPR